MKEQLEQRAQEVLMEMLDGLQKAADFTVEQAPLVIQELLTWKLAVSAMTSIFFLILGLTAAILCFKYMKWGLKKDDSGRSKIYMEDLEQQTVCICGICGIAVIVSTLVLMLNLDWLKILIAPRLYLLEYAANLVS